MGFTRRSKFIGRHDQITFFRDTILMPDNPTQSFIFISGQVGMGKSALLKELELEASISVATFTARVDVGQGDARSTMSQIIRQLQVKGDFERMISYSQARIDKLKTPPDPLYHFTRAFVSDLNALLKKQHAQKMILFLDTADPGSEKELASWIFSYLIPKAGSPGAALDRHIIFVIAGRRALNRLIQSKDQPQLLYDSSIRRIVLESFTKEETYAFLAMKRINAKVHEQIWRRSRGLPLYLELFATRYREIATSESNHENEVADLVENDVLKSLLPLPPSEQLKYRLALDAALLCRPFQRNDLKLFGYIPEDEGLSLYSWLIKQPFLLPDQHDRHYRYHEAVKYFFIKSLYAVSAKDVEATRSILIQAYREKLEDLSSNNNQDRSLLLDTTLSLAGQLFFMPDEISYVQAVECILSISKLTEIESAEIGAFLHSLEVDVFISQKTHRITQILIKYVRYAVQTSMNNKFHKEFLNAAMDLLISLQTLSASAESDISTVVHILLQDITYRIEKYQNIDVNNERANALKTSYYELRSKLYEELGDHENISLDSQQTMTTHNIVGSD